uniref:Phycobiliprotein ApcE n=1 Tax=Anotrichium furcellatum TaxID=41999 RepID=A0A4D6WK18_9FLOR|nr:gbilisome linker polypeptide [Anotrichium furcellatum]
MISKASGGTPSINPKLYRTASLSTIIQAEQQDRFLQLGELNDLIAFLNSGNKRLLIADAITKNANLLVSQAADKIFVGGSPISYLEKSQASFLEEDSVNQLTSSVTMKNNLSGDVVKGLSSNLFNAGDTLPPGFKPINVVRYGSERMKKSLRDLDWFLRYLTYAIVAGDTNILSVNIRGLRELIDNACSSAAASVALREMRKIAVGIFKDDIEAQELVQEYFNVIINEFDASRVSDKLRKRVFNDLQGLKLPRSYAIAGTVNPKFVMKSSLSNNEKILVIKACYRQVFERDIVKAYNIQFTDLESKLKIGQLSVKEFIRFLGKSSIYREQFYDKFVNSRVLELSFKHFLGRGLGSIEEFKRYFAILSTNGLSALIDSIINSSEYADYFGEETVPYLRNLGEEAQESRNWGAQISLFNYSNVFKKVPQFITLFARYQNSLPDQHPYGFTNDPLGIQFGAIFPKSSINSKDPQAFFNKDTRRLLLRFGPGIYNQVGSPKSRAITTGSLGPKVFKHELDSSSISQGNLSVIINAVYLRVFGRLIYQEELASLKAIENQFSSGVISVRDFIRLLVKSYIFRKLYWQELYLCKAIEYIHVRVLGRPTYGRQEINQYFDIAYKQDYYHMIDSMIDSREYIETFGENIVPYERYFTSSTNLSRKLSLNVSTAFLLNRINSFKEKSSILPVTSDKLTSNKLSIVNIKQKISQGVSSRRDQIKIFELNNKASISDKYQILRAIYRQIFERDLNTFSIGDEFYNLEKAFIVGEISIKELVEQIGCSNLYLKEFYSPYPNIKVIELGTKHFLGRAPNNQAEIRYYNQILASKGHSSFIMALVNSAEYNIIFGENIVPYHRFPTLPAANFPNTQKLYNIFVKQNKNVVVPSFIP